MLLFIRLTNIALDPAFIFIWAGAVTFIIGFTGIQVYFLGVQISRLFMVYRYPGLFLRCTDIQVIYWVYRYPGLFLRCTGILVIYWVYRYSGLLLG